MKEVTLGSSEFKALSSDNRVKILKMLNERKFTLTEIAKKLNLTSPSSKQHLDILLKSQLVELIDEGRKWKYYSLTRKGKDLLDAEERQTTVLLLLSLTGIMFFGLMFLYTNPYLLQGINAGNEYVQPRLDSTVSPTTTEQGASIAGNTAQDKTAPSAAIQSTAPSPETTSELPSEKPDTTPVAIALIVVAGIMILLVLQYSKIRKIVEG
jgi:DNA-binding transcriptional ArsR family regulator